ncbi:MAG: hypothetical protein QXM31_01915 [Candidatus Woesearchaeota archaeon]
MGILDWFRKKTPQEKTVLELARDKAFVDDIETAFSIMLDFEGRISGFLNDIVKSAKDKKVAALKDAVEKHGFMNYSEYSGWAQSLDAEKLAVSRYRMSKLNAILEESQKMLDLIAALRQMLKGKKSGIKAEQALSVLLRARFDKFKAAVSENIHSLWTDLQKYPELIDRKMLDRKFEKFRMELGAELDIINKIIEHLIVAEREVA